MKSPQKTRPFEGIFVGAGRANTSNKRLVYRCGADHDVDPGIFKRNIYHCGIGPYGRLALSVLSFSLGFFSVFSMRVVLLTHCLASQKMGHYKKLGVRKRHSIFK